MREATRYVVRGELRKDVLLALSRPNTPTLLAKRLKKDRPSVSRSILFLYRKGLLICINPTDKRGRLYEQSDEGKKVAEDIEDMM